MPDFDSLEEMYTYMQKQIDLTLKGNVAPIIKQVETEEIEQSVLNIYNPIKYERRIVGGIEDYSNLKDDVIDGILTISNDTPLNNDYGINNSGKTLSDIIITGEGYMYPKNDPFSMPRDYIDATINKLNQTNEHIEMLKDGLESLGIDIE